MLGCMHAHSSLIIYHIAGKFGEFGESSAIHQTKLVVTIKVTVLLINNFVGAKVYCLKVALCFFCVKWTKELLKRSL